MDVGLKNTFSCVCVVEILSHDLQDGAEDEKDYDAPDEGNLLYKLYSLQDLLLLVRSSVALTHTRKVGSQNQVNFSHIWSLNILYIFIFEKGHKSDTIFIIVIQGSQTSLAFF